MSVDFKNVRDAYELTGFFEGLMGAKSKLVSGGLRYSACPSCGPSSDASVKCSVRNNRWHCFACEKRGDVIDAAASFFGVSQAEAAKQLVGEGALELPKRVDVTPAPRVERDQGAINEVIGLLLRAQKLPDATCLEYLKGRSIPAKVVQEAVFRQVLLTLPGDPNAALRYLLDVVGRDLLIKSGIWKEGSKAPAACYRPLAFVSADKRGIEFKLIGSSSVAVAKTIRYGEPAPMVWRGSEHVMVVEGGVDLLSAVVMGTRRTVIGLPGARNWNEGDAWIKSLRGKHVLLATDDDEAGNMGASALQEILKGQATTRRYQHRAGCKDLNDQLRLESRIK